MNRLNLKAFLWTILMVTVFMTAVELAPVTKSVSSKTTKMPSRTTATVESRSTSKPKSRNTSKPKNSGRTTTTSPDAAMDDLLKSHFGVTATSSSKKKHTTKTAVKTTARSTTKTTAKPSTKTTKKSRPTTRTTTTTTLSPIEIMNRLYQMHGMAPHSSYSSYHSHSHSPSSSSSSSSSSAVKKKPQPESSMDDIYRLHAMAVSQSSSSNKKKGSDSSSSSYSSSSSNSDKNKNSIESIYQQHSHMPSSMHHIMAQHSVQSQHSSSPSRPEKTKSHPLKESTSSSLSTLVQPLLKQLTPVGAGISVVLAPLLLFNGFLTFFSNMSRFLNNFAQTILPVRRPVGQPPQNSNQYFQNLGHAHLKRQPRDWLEHLQNIRDIQELAEFIYKNIKESELPH